MDFNPDEAIAAGWLRPDSLAARFLERLSRYSLRHATAIIALDTFMRDRIAAKGIDPDKIVVLPPWSHDDEVRFDPAGRARFRTAHGLDGKFVVMYSGNHSPCHPLDTVLEAAKRLADDPAVAFCFVGGGSEWRKICTLHSALSTSPQPPQLCTLHSALSTFLCLPYQPLSELSGSLSAADLHLVVMGDPFVGLVHPCKIYNILSIGAPVLYIGPRPSHVTELLDQLHGRYPYYYAAHGDVDAVLRAIEHARRQPPPNRQLPTDVHALFAKETILPRLIDAVTAGKAEI